MLQPFSEIEILIVVRPIVTKNTTASDRSPPLKKIRAIRGNKILFMKMRLAHFYILQFISVSIGFTVHSFIITGRGKKRIVVFKGKDILNLFFNYIF